MKCKHCGAELAEGIPFCRFCGMLTADAKDEAQEASQKDDLSQKQTLGGADFGDETISVRREARTAAPASGAQGTRSRFCAKCGEKIETDAVFCAKCGASVRPHSHMAGNAAGAGSAVAKPNAPRRAVESGARQERAQRGQSDAMPGSEQADRFDGIVSGWMTFLRVITIVLMIIGVVMSFVLGYHGGWFMSLVSFSSFPDAGWFWSSLIGSLVTLIIGSLVMVFLDMAEDVRVIKNKLMRS